MNILPKKSWHVRTKQNIARVRRDEAKAAEEEKETQRKIALAAQEVRTQLLRERASQRLADVSTSSEVPQGEHGETGIPEAEEPDTRFGLPLGSLRDVVQPDGHVNFFQDVEGGKRQGGVNDEYEDEKRKEQEDYEKKIGYLVYLGQDSIEHSKNKPWYSSIDRGRPKELGKELENEKDKDRAAGVIGGLEEKSKTISVEEIRMTKFKNFLDPLKDIRKHLTAPGVKRKLDSFTSSSKSCKKTDSVSSPSKKPRVDDVSKRSKKEKRKKHKNKISKKSKKHKKHKKHAKSTSGDSDTSSSWESEDSEDDKKRSKLEELRAERLQREREERRRAEKVLAKLRGEPEDIPTPTTSNNYDSKNRPETSVKQKYNSQFNPHLARQNYDYQ
ncbi:unnamed protein product [Orchesella dallaii]|uniref:CBF1-interacting co-repressor CIR N-terminal domain-containing protein n=1 Tax=Orchesella dallaii TaxID=48710 RepID=A0ABP1QAX1_9HEXA